MDAIANLTAATRKRNRAELEWLSAIHAAADAGRKLETIAAAAGVDGREVEKILGRPAANG